MKKPTDFYGSPPAQGPVGSAPIKYIEGELPGELGPYESSVAKVPGQGRRPLSRTEVREVSRDLSVHPLVAYASIMAWGGRNFHNYRLSLAVGNAQRVMDLVQHLRASESGREQDFAFTQRAAKDIKGLGISFYTKLLFFLRPNPDAYILDQWTVKSVSVLFPQTGIKPTPSGLPDPSTAPETYGSFCRAIESCVGDSEGGWGAAWKTGEEVERTIFDRPRGPWRAWIKGQFKQTPDDDGDDEVSTLAAGAGVQPPVPPRRTVLPPPPPPPGGGDMRRAFANYLSQVYAAHLQARLNIPAGDPAFAAPNRVHVQAVGCVTWQFIINQHDVRAQVFFYPDCVATYDEVLVPALAPAVVGGQHVFHPPIVGNGPNNGATRAINSPTAVPGGFAAPVAQWPAICNSAVHAMHQLYGLINPHLP